MNDSLFWVLGVAGLAGLATWCYRRRLAALTREPTPGFIRACRIAGRIAGIVCGVAALVLIWAGATQPGVSALYAYLGGFVLVLNLLLFVRVRPGRGR